jgi:hypothetical protein
MIIEASLRQMDKIIETNSGGGLLAGDARDMRGIIDFFMVCNKNNAAQP